MKPKALFLVPPSWVALGKPAFATPAYDVLFAGQDNYAPGEISYFVGFRPLPGFLKTLPNLKLAIAPGAGVDGYMADSDYPRAVPLVRFTDPLLAYEMAQYVTMHALIIHRHQRDFDAAQKRHEWKPWRIPRATVDTRIGILGLGEIGGKIAERLALYGFQVSGWSRSRKSFTGVKSFAGDGEMDAFLGQCDMVACVLPQTPETANIMNAAFFAKLPKGAWVINVARGGVLVDDDLIAALDSGHLGGAVLDVFRTEPLPSDHPFWAHPRITVTPHVAGITDPHMVLDYLKRTISGHIEGKPLVDVVDMSRGY